MEATDGNLYGTTGTGGQNNSGTAFRISPTGAFQTIYNFCSQTNCADGAIPAGGFLQGSDGNFYGTSAYGGNQSDYCNGTCGTIFKLTPQGTLTTLYKFCSQPNCDDGGLPLSLMQATDGTLYGTTSLPRTSGGTVFKLTSDGTLTTLYTFCSQPYCADGEFPLGLVESKDGIFYGVTGTGGYTQYCVDMCGTLYSLTSSGTFQSLYHFCKLAGCMDGVSPETLLQALDGNFYGVTAGGGLILDAGTVFRFSPPGTLTTLYQFCSLANCADGQGPLGMIQGSDGNFYGITVEGGSTNSGTVFKLTGPTPPAVQYMTVTECRLLDTRLTGTPVSGGTWQNFLVPSLGSCNVPSTALAYSLNITAVPHQSLGYMTVWPAGRSMPYASTLNSLDARIKANAAIVPAGASNAISVYASDTADVILDINGYFTTPGSQTLQFYPLTPCRVIDTRGANGDLGGPYLQAQVERDFPLPESNCIPSSVNVAAYSMNFTVTPHPAGQPLGYLTVWPTGETQPVVSTLNNPTATVVANAAIVAAGTGGGIAVYPDATTDLVVDIDGYFAAPGQNGYSFYPVAPCRAFDSRNNNGQPFTGELTIDVAASPCALPANSSGYVFNATVVPSGSLGYLTLWPDGETRPLVSTLNAYDGFTASNMAIVPNMDGSIDAYAAGYTQLVLDISGYFAPN